MKELAMTQRRNENSKKDSLEQRVAEITQGATKDTIMRPYPGQEHYVQTYVSAGVTEN